MNEHIVKKKQHEYIEKSAQPIEGKSYKVSSEETDLYNATFVSYKGGCWATIRVDEVVNPAYTTVFSPGTEFDIRVAMYSYSELM